MIFLRQVLKGLVLMGLIDSRWGDGEMLCYCLKQEKASEFGDKITQVTLCISEHVEGPGSRDFHSEVLGYPLRG